MKHPSTGIAFFLQLLYFTQIEFNEEVGLARTEK